VVLIVVLAVVGLLGGCVTTSPVVPAQPGMYSVRAANDSCSSACESPQLRAMRRARAYCANMKKMAIAEDFQQSDDDMGFSESYKLTFSCAAVSAAR
jgi:hypothetical protein